MAQKQFSVPLHSPLPEDVAANLFSAWVLYFAERELKLTSSGSGGSGATRTYSFGDPAQSHFELALSNGKAQLTKVVGLPTATIHRLVRDAAAHLATNNTGDGVIYQTTMTIRTLDILRMSHFMRTLGDQRHITGARRLADIVLLDFNADPVGPESLFAPEAEVTATMFAPGPTHSTFSQQAAAAITETTAAICALAAGRPVDYFVPMFPLEEPEVAAAVARRRDTSVLGLARDHVSLDIFGDLPQLGGLDAMVRLRGSLLAYHAALKQDSPDVAVMLFVTSIEALIAPRQPWGKDKVTQRFIKSLTELCPAAVDQTLGHPNVQEAFDFRLRGGQARRRKELLSVVYDSRSVPTHTGLTPSDTGALSVLGNRASMQVALLSDLTVAAILSFMQAPRSSLVGHPLFDGAGVNSG